MKNTVLVFVLFFLKINDLNDKHVIILIDKNKLILTYKIINRMNNPIYVPEQYYWRRNGDSIVMESIYKPKKGDLPMNANLFIPPLMKKISGRSFFIMRKVLNENLSMSKNEYYFRIYNKNDNSLTSGNRVSSKTEFINFEKKNSKLIKANISR